MRKLAVVLLLAGSCANGAELVSHTQVVINASPEQVWPHILETSAWKSGGRHQHFSGTRGTVGEVFFSIPRGQTQPAYYVQNVELTRNKRRTIKLFGLGSDAPLMGYASWELAPEGRRTRLTYHVYSEERQPPDPSQPQDEYEAENNARFKAELESLKQLLERGSSHAAFPPDFDALASRVMKDWSIPGVAVAVVEAGKAPALRTYGVRQFDRDLAVDPRTLFGLASVTKTFVAAGIALLVQDGRLNWDDPVIQHLPEFRVADPLVTRQATVRDLLAHRTGIASHGDFLEEIPGLSEERAVGMLANYGQSMPFRAGGEYSSYTYIVLARIIERLSGKSWPKFLRERLWTPLGMRDIYARATDFAPAQNVLPTGDGWSDAIPRGLAAVSDKVNVAVPHVQWEAAYARKLFNDPRELDNRTVHFHRTAIDSGQGAFASIEDMARWAQVLLQGGDGSVLDRQTVAAMRSLTSVRTGAWTTFDTPSDAAAPTRVRAIGYGLGFEIYERDGRMLFGHTGGELGFASWIIVDPTDGFAVVALVNNHTYTRGSVPTLVQSILDWRYGSQSIDWSSYYLQLGRERHATRVTTHERLAATRAKGASKPDLAAYVGEYTSPLTGTLWIQPRAGGLIATTGPGYEIELRHHARDTFVGPVVSALRIPMSIGFERDAFGDVTGLGLKQAGDTADGLHYSRVRTR